MSTNTPNYNLVKPDENDFYDINVQNDNLDTIDQALKDNSDAAAANAQTASDNEDSINALAQTAAANAQAISENSDEIADNAQSISEHEDYAARMLSGIDLSAGDVILPSDDYYKGMLVVSAAHETNALILPGVNSHRYDIYNADAQHTLLVKKAGGTALEIPPQKLCRVAYDGTQYRMIAGSDAIVYKNPSPIKAGDDLVGNLLAWIKETGQWEKREFGMPYDGSGIVSAGKFASEGLFPASEIGYKLFRQQDGTIGTLARSESYYLGWIENEDTAWIGMLGGVDKEYTDDMDSFFAIPGTSGKIRLKIKMPATADGAMIRRSTSAYDGSGIAWGELVANITDDSAYDGDNEWYEDDDGGAGLSNGTLYYYKAFPYLGGTYNAVDGGNETKAKAGGLIHEYTMDNIAGSTVVDEAGGANLTASNVSYETGDVGNRAVFNGSSSYISANGILTASQLDGTFTIDFLLNVDLFDGSDILFLFYQYRDISIGISNNTVYVNINSGGAEASAVISAGTTYHITIVRDKSSGIYIYVQAVQKAFYSWTGNAATLSTSSYIGSFGGSGWFLDGRISQIRLFNRKLEPDEILSLQNGGNYC